MPWISFTSDFNWHPPAYKNRVTIAYKHGMVQLVTRVCADEACLAGKGHRIRRENKMSLSVLIMFGADKGGVGKTTLARAFLDQLNSKGITSTAYDTEPDPGVLRRFYPSAKSIDVSVARGQVEIFDAAPTAGITVVDLKATSLSRVLASMRDAGLLKDVHAGKLIFRVVHILGSTEASMREIEATRAILAEGGEHILVKNRATDGHFFEWDSTAYKSFFEKADAGCLLDIPHLDGMACDAVELSGQPFAQFIDDPKNSRTLRGKVEHWRGLVWAEFDRAKLANLAG